MSLEITHGLLEPEPSISEGIVIHLLLLLLLHHHLLHHELLLLLVHHGVRHSSRHVELNVVDGHHGWLSGHETVEVWNKLRLGVHCWSF